MEKVIINFNKNEPKQFNYATELINFLMTENFNVAILCNSGSYDDRIEQLKDIEKNPSMIYNHRLEDYGFKSNDYVLIITSAEVETRRVNLYEVGIGEIGSLNVDETIKFLKSKLN